MLLTRKMQNADVLPDLNIEENCLMNSIVTQKLQYFGHVKCHNGLERTAMGGVFPAGQRLTQDIEYTLGMRQGD